MAVHENSFIEVEVAYARPDKQTILVCEVPSNATLREAIVLSDIKKHYSEIDLEQDKVGLFSRMMKDLDAPGLLNAHDRIEIYRPLIADPKEVRKRKAAAKGEG